MKANPIIYHNLESYLFDKINHRFASDHYLDAFDFFCIIIWKANRSKSKISQLLINNDPKGRISLDPIVHGLTQYLYKAKSDKEKMRILIQDWGFRLPIASAILTVLWPNNFTIYDKRVCDSLNNYHRLKNKTDFNAIWEGYLNFMHSVNSNTPNNLSLREKDRYLWGDSFQKQLRNDIKNLFNYRKDNQ